MAHLRSLSLFLSLLFPGGPDSLLHMAHRTSSALHCTKQLAARTGETVFFERMRGMMEGLGDACSPPRTKLVSARTHLVLHLDSMSIY